MAKLHELLAVQQTLHGQAEKTRKDLLVSFDKKRHLFSEKVVTFTPFEEAGKTTTEEQSDLQTTIVSELKWLAEIIAPAIDVAFQVDEANTSARADVIIDRQVILPKVPATALLQLEKRANELHEFVSAIPTLDPAKGFQPDPVRGVGISKAREVVKTRTKKTQRPLVLTPATDKHPAQVQLITEDIPVGTIQELEWSGLITPSEKAKLIDRAERLRNAVRQARARANEQSITQDDNKIGKVLLDYVFGPSA